MSTSARRLFACAFLHVALLAAQVPPSTIDDRVRALYNSGRWAEAASVAASAPVQSAALVFYRALALARMNQLAQAATLFEEGARLYPRDKRFPLESAGIAYREKNFSAAKAYLHRALRLDPADSYGNDFLATLFLLDENLPAALKYWNRIGKPLIQDVQFAPPVPLDPVLRERAFVISAGQVFTLERLWTTQANLHRLDVFANTRFELLPSGGPRASLVIRAEPLATPLAGWAGAVLPMLRELPYQTLDFDRYNIRRRGLNLTSVARWDSNKRRLFLQLSGPLRMNPRIEYAYSADARDENWNLPAYGAGLKGLGLRKYEAGADFSIGLSGKLQWTVGPHLAHRNFHNGDAGSFFSNGWSAELRNRFDYRLLSWPDRRLHLDSWAILDAGRIFTAFPSRLISTRAGIKGEWFPQAKGDKYSVVALFHAGRTFGNAPLDQLFMLGMERDTPSDFWLRGHVATTGGRKGTGPLGREFALSQLQLDRRFFQLPFIRFQAGPFLDSGWTADPSGQFGSHAWLVDTGVEAKITTIGGIAVRLVYGWNLPHGRGVFYSAVTR